MSNYSNIIAKKSLVELEVKKIMKKFTNFVLFISVVLLLSGCGKEEKVETPEEYYLSLAKEADTYERVYEIIEEYSSETEKQESFKEELVFLKGNDTVQEALLVSEDCTPELMISIFKNHKWSNIHYTKRRNLLMESISKMTSLTSKEEMEIAKLGVETYQAGLLLKPDVYCDTLCYLLNKDTTKLNLEYYKYREWIALQAARDWSMEEKINLLNTENRTVKEVFNSSQSSLEES